MVSGERIGNELRLMLGQSNAPYAFQWLLRARLWYILAGDRTPETASEESELETLRVLTRLGRARFPLSLAAILKSMRLGQSSLASLSARWKLTNREVDEIAWLLTHVDELAGAQDLPWHEVQQLLIHAYAPEAIELAAAIASAESSSRHLDFCRQRLAWPKEKLDPAPLIDGNDLKSLEIPAGPIFGQILNEVRSQQLDGLVETREQALLLAARIAATRT